MPNRRLRLSIACLGWRHLSALGLLCCAVAVAAQTDADRVMVGCG